MHTYKRKHLIGIKSKLGGLLESDIDNSKQVASEVLNEKSIKSFLDESKWGSHISDIHRLATEELSGCDQKLKAAKQTQWNKYRKGILNSLNRNKEENILDQQNQNVVSIEEDVSQLDYNLHESTPRFSPLFHSFTPSIFSTMDPNNQHQHQQQGFLFSTKPQSTQQVFPTSTFSTMQPTKLQERAKYDLSSYTTPKKTPFRTPTRSSVKRKRNDFDGEDNDSSLQELVREAILEGRNNISVVMDHFGSRNVAESFFTHPIEQRGFNRVATVLKRGIDGAIDQDDLDVRDDQIRKCTEEVEEISLFSHQICDVYDVAKRLAKEGEEQLKEAQEFHQNAVRYLERCQRVKDHAQVETSRLQYVSKWKKEPDDHDQNMAS